MTESSGRVPTADSGRYRATGYQMIRDIEIDNFRGIHSARFANLKRINILVGPNGTAKTAFLEAIFLAAGNTPENLIKTKAWRGRQSNEVSGEPSMVMDFLWADTFADPARNTASVRLFGDDPDTRSVEISKTTPKTLLSPGGPTTLADVGMEFVWDGPQGRAVSRPQVRDNALVSEMVYGGTGVHFFPARMNVSEKETASAFSRLSIEGNADLFLEPFLAEFDWLSDVGVEAPIGNPAIFARMPNGRKLPLTMISGGISHLAGLLLRLAAHPGSTLLIDEIENGFYYERYQSTWRSLHNVCRKNNCQLFATSHSLEALRALGDVLSDKADDVSFIRSRLERGKVVFEQFDAETFFDAMKIGEVR